MKITASFLFLPVLAALAWFMWRFQPLMSGGQAVHVSTGQIGRFDFQVWQRKNSSTFEPFATGLFVHKKGEPWRVFLLDFEDVYHPNVRLRKENAGVVVIEHGKKLGIIDDELQTFKRESDGASFPCGVLDGEPPSSWWLK